MHKKHFGDFIRLFMICPGYVIALCIIEVFSAVSVPIMLDALSNLIDGVGEGQIDRYALLIYISVSVLIIVATYLQQRYTLSLRHIVERRMNNEWMDKSRRICFSTFEDPDALDHLQRAKEATQGKLPELFTNLLSLIGNLIRMLGLILVFGRTGFVLPLLFIVVWLITIYADYKAISLMNNMFHEESNAERLFSEYERILTDRYSVSYLSAIKGIGVFRTKVKNLAKALGKERITTTIKAQKYSMMGQISTLIWFAGALVYLIRGVSSGIFAIGIFVACLSALAMALDVSEQLSVGISNISEDAVCIDEYFEFMALPQVKTIKELPEGDKDYFIEFKNVSFIYPGTDVSVLSNLNLKIKCNERVALVGINGSGKTTLMKLMLRLYEPTEGNIYINGHDIREYTTEEISKIYSVVFQDYARFDLPIVTNINMDNYIENAEDIDMLLSDVGLSELCDKKDMYLGQMEEEHIDLSGGQWQRLALARALYKKKGFVLFDEPLSAVDPIAEADLYEELMKRLNGRGCLMISHRLGSTRKAGRKMEAKIEELIDRKGCYSELFAEQAKWYI